MNAGLNNSIRLVIGLLVYLLPLAANAVALIEGVDYNDGNGRGAPVAEAVAGYAHKDEALDHFTKRRLQAIKQLYPGADENLPINLRNLKGNYEELSMDPRYADGKGEYINFLTRSGLEKCQVFLINQKFYHYNNNAKLVLYSSKTAVLDGFTGDIIVMDRQGNIFIHPKEMGSIHHSSFFSQKPIAFGAMVRIKDGEIVRSDFTKDNTYEFTLFPKRVERLNCRDGLLYYSGHYDPHSGSEWVKRQIKREALNNFRKELTKIHFWSEDKWFMLISVDSGKALDSYGDENPPFYYIGKSDPHYPGHDHYDRQLWKIKQLDSQYFMIISKDSKKALDSQGNSRLLKHVVGKHAVHSSKDPDYPRQKWQIVREGDHFRIISADANRALDSQSGNKVCKWRLHPEDHDCYDRQLWEFRLVN